MSNDTSPQNVGFCADRFWDTELLVTSSWPRLTQCFQDTILIYAPFACFWLPLPIYMYTLASRGDRPLPMSCLTVMKMFLASSLSLLSLIIIVEDASNNTEKTPIPAAMFVANSIRVVSYAAVTFLMLYERKYHVTTSGVVFLMWAVLVICDVVPLYSKIMLEEYSTLLVRFVLFAIMYGMEVLQFLLNCTSDSAGEVAFSDRSSPEIRASLLSQIFYGWATKIVYRGWRKDLEESELFDLNPRDTSDTLVPVFETEWTKEKARFRRKMRQRRGYSDPMRLAELSYSHEASTETEPLLAHMNGTVHRNNHYRALGDETHSQRNNKKPKPSLLRVLTCMVGDRLVIGLIQKLVSDVFLLLSPVLLSLLISYADNKDTDYAWKGYVLAVLLFLTQMFKSIFFNFSFWMSQIVGMQMKTSLIAAIYRKALTMSNEAKKESTAGEIVNLMSVDCQRVQDVMNFFFFAWTTPVQVIVAMAVLYQYLGPSVFAGLAVLLLTVPFNSYIAAKQQELNTENLKYKDARLRLTNEALCGMKVLKLYAWEPPFQTKISDIRSQETRVLLKIAYLNVLISVCFNAAPYLVMLATFAVYVNVSDENHLDANKAFVALSFFNLLRVPLALLATIISMSVQAIVSVQRINNFLCTGDLRPDNITKDSRAAHAIEIENGTFTWDSSAAPTLRNINLKIPEGKLYAVVGPVGCGKSSLMSALLGEMEKVTGKACIKSKVAYVPQQAWIQNATVKDNILFGKPLIKKKYKKVLHACALERDLEILSAGDMTEIGEKGINLSGGQKQRVSLARAVYSGADIFIFDDPLSAVDTHVGKHIFNHVIGKKGVLKGKTRVLVTHGAHWLPMVDSIVVLQDGEIREAGSYEDLMSHNGPFAEFIRTYLLQEDETEEGDSEVRAMTARVWNDVETVATSDGATSGDEGFSRQHQRPSLHRYHQKQRNRSPTLESLFEVPFSDLDSYTASGAELNSSEITLASEGQSLEWEFPSISVEPDLRQFDFTMPPRRVEEVDQEIVKSAPKATSFSSITVTAMVHAPARLSSSDFSISPLSGGAEGREEVLASGASVIAESQLVAQTPSATTPRTLIKMIQSAPVSHLRKSFNRAGFSEPTIQDTSSSVEEDGAASLHSTNSSSLIVETQQFTSNSSPVPAMAHLPVASTQLSSETATIEGLTESELGTRAETNDAAAEVMMDINEAASSEAEESISSEGTLWTATSSIASSLDTYSLAVSSFSPNSSGDLEETTSLSSSPLQKCKLVLPQKSTASLAAHSSLPVLSVQIPPPPPSSPSHLEQTSGPDSDLDATLLAPLSSRLVLHSASLALVPGSSAPLQPSVLPSLPKISVSSTSSLQETPRSSLPLQLSQRLTLLAVSEKGSSLIPPGSPESLPASRKSAFMTSPPECSPPTEPPESVKTGPLSRIQADISGTLHLDLSSQTAHELPGPSRTGSDMRSQIVSSRSQNIDATSQHRVDFSGMAKIDNEERHSFSMAQRHDPPSDTARGPATRKTDKILSSGNASCTKAVISSESSLRAPPTIVEAEKSLLIQAPYRICIPLAEGDAAMCHTPVSPEIMYSPEIVHSSSPQVWKSPVSIKTPSVSFSLHGATPHHIRRHRSSSSSNSSSSLEQRSRTMSVTYESQMTASLLTHSQTVIYDEDDSGERGLGKLVQDERMEKGKVKLAVFWSYSKAMGTCAVAFSFLLFALFQAASAWSNFWLTDWTGDTFLANLTYIHTPEYKEKKDYYLVIFGIFGIVQIFFLTTHNIIYWIRMVIAAKRLHLGMLASIFRSPMSFFDTTPLGRIMNRFSRDIEVVDNNLPIIVRDYTSTLFTVLVTIIIISINTPLFLTLMVPIMILYYFIQNFYIPTSRQLKRIESVTRSPIYAHFSETISGGPTIRAYDVTARFLRESKNRVDRNQSFYYISLAANRWLGISLEILANLIILGSAVFAVVTPGISGGDVGLSVSYAIQVSSNLVWMVRQMSDLETNIVSVERLKEYSELDSEAEWIVPHRRPVPDWPLDGRVEFSNYTTRYRPGLDLVLRGISCEIKPGEKIGIVGRTGAGKSSLALALFRLIEASGGSISVDGIKISNIGLHDVRSRLTILPQDPVLFFGTLRMNLDPVDEYDDHQLWEALTSAHLRDFVDSLPEGLDYEVGEEGQALSVGQRQLVCLARALLKKTKILILDEATAAVDMETDTLIQNTIRSEFEHCTIITIAHRLNTIMDYDRIMVLDAGLIKELDTPSNLLANQESVFYSMAKEANLV